MNAFERHSLPIYYHSNNVTLSTSLPLLTLKEAFNSNWTATCYRDDDISYIRCRNVQRIISSSNNTRKIRCVLIDCEIRTLIVSAIIYDCCFISILYQIYKMYTTFSFQNVEVEDTNHAFFGFFSSVLG